MANAGLARFDSVAGPLFVAAGMGDPATFQRGVETAISMSATYFDEAVQAFGNQSQVPQSVRVIRIFKSFGIPEPMIGDKITLNPATVPEYFAVDALAQEDASSYVVTVVPVTP